MNYHRVYIPNSFVHIIIASYERKHIFIDNIEILRTAFKIQCKIINLEFLNADEVAKEICPEHIESVSRVQFFAPK